MPKTLAIYTTTEKIDNKLEIAQPIFQVKEKGKKSNESKC